MISGFFRVLTKGTLKEELSREGMPVCPALKCMFRPLSLKTGLRYLPVCFKVGSMQATIISHRDVIAPSPTPLQETLVKGGLFSFSFWFCPG